MPPGEARTTSRSWRELFTRMRALYQKEGGAFPDPIVNLSWPYAHPDEPDARRARQGILTAMPRGSRRPEGPDQDRAQGRRAARRLRGIARRRQRPPCGCWIFCGAWTEAGNLMARRDNSDPPASARRSTGPGRGRPTGACFTTAPRAIRAASRSIRGASYRWNGSRWSGADVPDFKADEIRPTAWALHHECGRRGAILRPQRHGRGPVPRALRAVRDRRSRYNPLNPNQPQASTIRRRACSRRSRGVRQGGAVPACGDDLSADRALPLLDQARRD